MLISRLGLVPDLDSFSGDADGALGVRAGLEGKGIVEVDHRGCAG